MLCFGFRDVEDAQTEIFCFLGTHGLLDKSLGRSITTSNTSI